MDAPAPNPTPPQQTTQVVPPEVSKQSMPLFLKIMIGCGCLGVLALFLVPILITFIAINPSERISEQNSRSNGSDVRAATVSVQTCITKEVSDGANPATIYSKNLCANPSYLMEQYTEETLSTDLVFSVNPTNSKICVYQGEGDGLASWDSTEGVIKQGNTGKTTCI